MKTIVTAALIGAFFNTVSTVEVQLESSSESETSPSIEEIPLHQPSEDDILLASEKAQDLVQQIEGLESERYSALSQELMKFIFKYDFLVKSRKAGRAQKHISRAQKQEAVEKLNKEIRALHKEAEKTMKESLSRKQFKQYKLLIAEIAPRPLTPEQRSLTRDDGWLDHTADPPSSSGYSPRNLNK